MTLSHNDYMPPTLILWYIPLLIVFLKKVFIYTFLWQKKEYRIDKMRDYILSRESRIFFFDRFNKIYYVLLTLIAVVYFIQKTPVLPLRLLTTILIAAFIVFISTLWVESIIWIYKSLHRSQLTPIFTPKALLTTVMSFVIGITIIIYSLNFSLSPQLIFHLFLLIFSPVIVGVSLLLLYPLDQIFKKRIISKAKNHRKTLTHLQVIAVSGSYGKTTTKEMIFHILSQIFATEKTEKNNNTTISIARKIINLKPTTQYFVAELGAYKVGDGAEICDYLRPTTSIITGLNHQHFSLFESVENIITAESESIGFLSADSTVFINGNSELCHQIDVPKPIVARYYGNEQQNAFATNIVQTITGSSFNYHEETTKLTIKTNSIGKGNIENLVGAIALCRSIGVSDKTIQKAVEHLPTIHGNMERIKTSWGTIINDSYNANTDGVINALLVMKEWKGQKIVVLDDILELGEKAIEAHKEVAIVINAINPDMVVLTGRNYTHIIEETLLNLGYKNIIIFSNEELAETIIKNEMEPLLHETNTLILLEGYQSQKFVQGLIRLSSSPNHQ
jgi:UDP-N-acetylmuramoyl-tripeptide--D-alanyl-D-alanine ligase